MGLLLPVCSIFFSGLLCLVYFSKRRINILENTMYAIMLICSLFDSILVTALQILALNGVNNIEYFFVVLFNKLDFISLIIICTCIFFYIILITIPKVKNNLNKFFIPFTIIDFLFVLILTFFNVEVIESYGNYSVGGSAVLAAEILCGVYLAMTILVVLFNLKKVDKRHIFVFAMVALLIMLLIVVKKNPYLIVVSIVVCFINYIMYFTIENPDLKLIAELNISKENAERANRAKSDFLSSMSHEIRTPLNAIVGLSEDIASRDNCPEDMQDDLKDVVSASRTLLEIVGNIIDINKIESDKLEINEVVYNLKEEIESLTRVNAVKIGDKPLELKLNIAEDVPYELRGDKVHIKQIVNNLLSNAIKYTDQGKVELNIQCINKKDKCNLIISCKDTGRGIKAENIKKLFTKFERLDVERNTTTEGTGLGLAITKKLVDLMGGKINVESQFGKGSIFMVQVPQKIEHLTKPMSEKELMDTAEMILKENKATDFSKKAILVVDDNILNIKVARKSLEPLGFGTIDECYNGQECLDKINSGKKYDLILMDIMMPVMSGETALKNLQQIPGFNTPVLALTADAIVGAKEKYVELGFINYISKPFNKNDIKKMIEDIFKVNQNSNVDRFKDAPTFVIDASNSGD